MKTEFDCETVIESINFLHESIKTSLLPASEDNLEENVNRISKIYDSLEKAQRISHDLISYKPSNGAESDLIYALIDKIDDFIISAESRKEFFEESI